MATGHSSIGYGHPSTRLCFDGDENKYETWEVKVLAYMCVNNLKDVISPDSNTISTQAQKEKAFAQLVQFLDDRSLALVMRDAIDDGRKAMKILRQHYAGAGQPRIISLWNALSSLQKQQSEDLTGYILRAETAATAIKNAGEHVSDTLLIAMVMNGLPPAYKPFVVFITQSDKTFTFADFKTSIRNFHENEAASITRRVDGMSEPFDGIMSFQHRQQNDRRENKPTHMRNGGQNPQKQQQPFQNPSTSLQCYTCGGSGHKSGVCPSLSNPNNNNNKSRDAFNRNNNNNNTRRWCSVCRNNSHTDKTCRKQNKKLNGGGRRNDDVRAAQHEEYNNHTFVMHIDDGRNCNEVYPDVNFQEPSDEFLVDSGSSSHIVNNTTRFVSFDDDFEPEKHSVTLANGKVEKVAEKRGTILINIRTDSGHLADVYLEKTLYIPSYPVDIFSVKAVTRNGGSVLLKSDDGLLTKDGTNFPIRTQDGELYYLDLYNSNAVVNDVVNSCKPSAIRTSSLEEWHRILGHVNKKDILKLEQVVEDMKITSKKDDFSCDTCTLSKQSVYRSRQPDERATAPLQFIHSDIAGPITPVAKDGLRYVINFVDDYTGASFVYFLKNKSDATKALEKFLCDVAPYGKVQYVITRLRSDNGGEYVSKDFEDVLLKHTIRHEFSAPHSPHQNGTAERNWRTLFEMARGMIIESGIALYLWSYAVMASAHIRNRMYCPRIQDTPYHMLTGKKPSISKLHLFGSVCFAYTQQKKKLDPRCSRGIFVGYDKYSPAYLVYFPGSRTIGKFGTVTFTEQYAKSTPPLPASRDLNTRGADETDTPFAFYGLLHNTPSHSGRIESTTHPIPHISIPNTMDANDDTRYEDNLLPTNEADANDAIPDENYEVPLLRNVTFLEHEIVAEETVPERRYPQRTRQTPRHRTDFTNYIRDACYRISETPASYSKALNDKDSDQWQQAMESEMNSMKDNDVYEVVPLPKGKKVVGSRWVYSIKDNPDGAVLHKARFVAKGFSQVEGSDYTDTYSPTA